MPFTDATRKVTRVGACCCHAYGVPEPLAPACPAEIVASAGVRGGFQVYSISTIAIARSIDRTDAVADSLTTRVVILSLDSSGNRGCCAIERAFGLQRRRRS